MEIGPVEYPVVVSRADLPPIPEEDQQGRSNIVSSSVEAMGAVLDVARAPQPAGRAIRTDHEVSVMSVASDCPGECISREAVG